MKLKPNKITLAIITTLMLMLAATVWAGRAGFGYVRPKRKPEPDFSTADDFACSLAMSLTNKEKQS
ncbi:MAG: hypothetical protein GY869_26990 [Planctomycetes bacterium]|nr:hypothetical protein [Planctomycetota bacterium]